MGWVLLGYLIVAFGVYIEARDTEGGWRAGGLAVVWPVLLLVAFGRWIV